MQILDNQILCMTGGQRSSVRHQRSSIKKVFLDISQNSQEKTRARASILIKLQLYQKRDSGTGVFQ